MYSLFCLDASHNALIGWHYELNQRTLVQSSSLSCLLCQRAVWTGTSGWNRPVPVCEPDRYQSVEETGTNVWDRLVPVYGMDRYQCVG